MTAIEHYTWLYPQLTLPISEGQSKSEEYKNIALRGILPSECVFPIEYSDLAEQITVTTPCGEVEALYLPERHIFEHFYRALAYKCEPVEIPRTTGAAYISGINNWRKIHAHHEDFLKTHTEAEWGDEFKLFTSNRDNYKDRVLLISRGYYSNVAPEKVGFTEEEWLNLSKSIRIYHELTHYISRELYPSHKEAVRDEVLADCIGIIGAKGEYDSALELKVLGIVKDGSEISCTSDCRLQNYVDEALLKTSAVYASGLIDLINSFIGDKVKTKEPFEWLLAMEDAKLGL